jgi:hypothetical protein
LLITACAPSIEREFCTLGLECTDPEQLALDPVPGQSEDSLEVCVVLQETSQAALRANSEPECSELADARDEFMACAVEEGCDALGNEGPCAEEQTRFTRLAGEAQNRCSE